MEQLPEALVVVLVALLVVLANAGVLFRYVFLLQVSGIDELQKMLLVWLAFTGGAVGVKRGAHFGVHLVMARLPVRVREAIAGTTELFVLVFATVLVMQGIPATKIAFRQVFTGLGISIGWQYLAVPVSGGLMVGYVCYRAYGVVARMRAAREA
ncbi:MAG: TRAP transporter small permease subunit [Candidatus Rokubacteria bacterium]|nr:TRAP transporter small permease subunit [Candidatus Rokubacteria bacterium]